MGIALNQSNPYKVYRALLTQTIPIVAYSIGDIGYKFIVGETYTIVQYNIGDDFSNIANVISGTINTDGCVFIATGNIPNIWSLGSRIDSYGNLIVDVLENTLGFDMQWAWAPFGGSGYYIGSRSGTMMANDFNREKFYGSVGCKYPFDWGGTPMPPSLSIQTSYTFDIDDSVIVWVFNYDAYNFQNYGLFYTPIEIKIYP